MVDEGHRLKNLNCRLIKELKQYQSANRLLLTGTPLQNNLAELWSLLNFLLPDIFDDLDSFQRWFDFSDVYSAEGDQRILAKEQEEQVLQGPAQTSSGTFSLVPKPSSSPPCVLFLQVLSKLHQILQPFLLRRVKTDVLLTLPPKKEVLLFAPLAATQQVSTLLLDSALASQPTVETQFFFGLLFLSLN